MKTKCGRYFCSAFTGHTGDKGVVPPTCGGKVQRVAPLPVGEMQKNQRPERRIQCVMKLASL